MRALASILALGACADPPSTPAPGEIPAFPADYAASYTEVRNCRKSGDHDLAFVRVLADAAAAAPYLDRAGDFPDGAVVLKEEYDFADSACSGPIGSITVMLKNSGASDRLSWDWQRVSAGREVEESNGSRCVTCHSGCNGAPVGYDFTCADP